MHGKAPLWSHCVKGTVLEDQGVPQLCFTGSNLGNRALETLNGTQNHEPQEIEQQMQSQVLWESGQNMTLRRDLGGDPGGDSGRDLEGNLGGDPGEDQRGGLAGVQKGMVPGEDLGKDQIRN